jgi:hypothetical protein
MNKQILQIVFIVFLTLFLTACGGKGGSGTDEITPTDNDSVTNPIVGVSNLLTETEKSNLINEMVSSQNENYSEQEKDFIKNIIVNIDVYKTSHLTKNGHIITAYADNKEEANRIKIEEGILFNEIVKPELLITNGYIKIDYGDNIEIKQDLASFSSVIGGKKINVTLNNSELNNQIEFIELLKKTKRINNKTIMSILRLDWIIDDSNNIEIIFTQDNFVDNPHSATFSLIKKESND